MDFLKAMFAYLALMATLSVQSGPLPQNVPTPTPLPTHVTATPVPYQTEAPTATPGPTREPVPTITPNARYETVRYQDRGTQVRKLQERLIALGYMPEGSADGAYGYQTYNAVKAFQQKNGLSADGVAGPTTLTWLFEYEGVISNATATPAPTATPTPSLPPLPTPAMTTAPAATETAAPAENAPAAPVLPESLPATVDVSAPAMDATPEATVPPTAAQRLGLTELADPFIIAGDSGVALATTVFVDGIPQVVKPRLFVNDAGDAVMLLHEIADCAEGWTLMGSSADGFYTLQAAGYVVQITTIPSVTVSVDGYPTALGNADVQALDGQVFVTAQFLESALGADTIFDEEEQSLVFFLPHKSMADAAD